MFILQIVEINGGTLKESNVKFRNPNEKINVFEFNVQQSSIIKVLGDHIDPAEPTVLYTPVDLIDAMKCEAERIGK